MPVKPVVDGLRGARGYRGARVLRDGATLFSEGIDREFADVALGLLRASPGVARVSIAARGFTFVAFRAEGYEILVRLAGHFPALPRLHAPEPEFFDPPRAPALPSLDAARREAEAALRAFGLIDR